MEEVTNPTSPGAQEPSPEEEIEMDKTRMDIDVEVGNKHESTATDIRVDSALGGKPAKKSARKVFRFGAFLDRLKPKRKMRFPFHFLSKLGIVCLGLPVLLILALLTADIFLFTSSDPHFFSWLGKPPSDFLNELWLVLSALEIVLIFSLIRGLGLLKIIVFLPLLFGLSGFILNIAAEVPLEASWNGAGFLSGFPHYLQPVTLVLQFVFPFLLLVWLGLVFPGKIRAGPLWSGFNLLVLLFSTLLGGVILWANRVPGPLAALAGGGEIPGSAAIVDEAEDFFLELQTNNFERNRGSDVSDRTILKLTPHSTSKFLLQARRLGGLPVFFLGKKDFVLRINGKIIDDWSLKPLTGGKEKGSYLVAVPAGPIPKREEIQISLPEHPPEYQQGEIFQFRVGGGFYPAVSFQVAMDSQIVSEGEVAEGKGDFQIPLSPFSPGDHAFEIRVSSVRDKVTRATAPVHIRENPGIKIVSPLSGDSFDDRLTVMAAVTLPPGASETAIHFALDDQIMAQKEGPPYKAELDTSLFAPGPHTLKVSTDKGGPSPRQSPSQEVVGGETPAAGDQIQEKDIPLHEPLTAVVPLVKGEHPGLDFVKPTLGEYLSFETPVEVAGSSFSLVELFLGDQKIHEWKTPPYAFDWNTSPIPSGSYILTARGKTDGGLQSSDWVEVVTGRGSLKVLSPENHPSRAGKKGKFDKIVFILDGSVSMLEGLESASKWDSVQQIFSKPDLSVLLQQSQAGWILSGGKTFFGHRNCNDSEWLHPFGSFSASKIKKALDSAVPKGTFSLSASLQTALGNKPKKIIILADGDGACPFSMTSDLEKKIRENKVKIDVILMGEVPDSKTVQLKKLATLSGGVTTQALFAEKIGKSISESLSFSMSLSEKGEQVYSQPLDSQPQTLRPGIYSLKINSDLVSEPINVNIHHGKETVVELSVENGTLVAREK